jgi:hypothetical protein
LHPNTLRTLQQGQVFAISKTIDPQWGLVNVAKAPEFIEQNISTSDLMQHLKGIRARYQHQDGVNYLNLNSLGSSPMKTNTKSLCEPTLEETWA